MARVPYPKRKDAPKAQRHVYDRMVAERGTPTANIFLALANVPHLLDPILTFAGALRNETIIEKRYRELAVLTVGLRTGSRYEFDHHWNAALKAGLTRDQLHALEQFETSHLFDDKERAVLRFAAEVTENGELADATWEALQAFFDLRESMEILLTVAWYNAVVRMLLPLKIENEDWFKRM